MLNPSIERHMSRPILAFFVFAALVVFAYAGWFGWHLQLPLSEKSETWGQLGDYVGGLLNPLISGAALIWLIRSVHIQTTQLKDARRALASAEKAQEEQARLNRTSAERESLNLRLSAVINELGHYRSTMNVWLRNANMKDRESAVLDEDGEIVPVKTAIAATRKRLHELTQEKDTLLQALEKLRPGTP